MVLTHLFPEDFRLSRDALATAALAVMQHEEFHQRQRNYDMQGWWKNRRLQLTDLYRRKSP
jgi:hypothetical protein